MRILLNSRRQVLHRRVAEVLCSSGVTARKRLRVHQGSKLLTNLSSGAVSRTRAAIRALSI